MIIDADGVIRYAASVTPAGERDMAALVAEAEAIAAAYEGELAADPAAPALAADARLFVKSRCGFSTAVLAAVDNLHLGDRLPIANVTEDPAAREELRRLTGKEQAPCLIAGGEALLESKAIIDRLVGCVAPC
ncbi:MAG: glutaredoxin [Myxococcales bacterium]|nr:glutaredoxin [Myxococcales bacterium]MCB9568910.1 glutaredoxin [Myxococcales bacterium]MCB9704922.1 glutaredoxin [Myxococcales bacterium]